MAKLTRTQKYAQLRDNLSSEKENTISTNDLAEHEDRLNNVIETLAPNTVEKPVVEENPNYSWTSFQEAPVTNTIKEEVKEKQEPSIIHETIVEPVLEADIQDNQKEEEYTISELQEPILSSDYLNYFSNPEIEKAYAEQEKKEAAQDVVEHIQVEDDNLFVPIEEEVKQPVEEIAEFVEPVEEVKEEVIDKKPIDTIQNSHELSHDNDVHNEYINNTINEVDEYNRQGGQTTIDELANNMVHEIRHPDQSKDDVFTEVPVSNIDMNDDNFSNTVSLEITKIMDEISNIESVPVTAEDKPAEPAKEIIEEHPVLTQALSEEDDTVEEVVEIKNINELKSDPIKDTTSGTIPFVVTNSEDEDIIDDDDDEEENSNTLLNVILIVLIVVLLAVLGLIIFYILKTRGII